MGEAIRFFRDLLGCEVAWELEIPTDRFARLHAVPSPVGRSVGVRCPDGGELELFELSEPRGEPRSSRRFEDAGLSVLTFQVDDVVAVMDVLSHNGYEQVGELVEFPLGTRAIHSVHFHGPSRIPITFTQTVDAGASASTT
jgi:catechol 2,3-dioxygenase-like lactoylglutathione lyase family enzyme